MQEWNRYILKPNTRQQQLEYHERAARELGWLKKDDPYNMPNIKHYVILDGRNLVGYHDIYENALKQACVALFYILPNQRGKGVGTNALLKILYTLYKLDKHPTIYCHVGVDNEAALHIYLKYGYIMGADQRLYESVEACKYPLIENNEYTIVFMEKVWGVKGYTMKNALEETFNQVEIKKK